jgi:hypothetical protein
MKDKVIVCYPNPDQILAGLSCSTQKMPQPFYSTGLQRNNQSKF